MLPLLSSRARRQAAVALLLAVAGAAQSAAMPAPRQLIVRLAQGDCTAAHARLLSRQGGTALHWLRALGGGACVLRARQEPDDDAFAALPRRLAALPGVAFAEIDHVSQRSTTRVQRQFDSGKQWYLDDPQSGINVQHAWRIAPGSPAVTVAVLDSGILYDHPQLRGRLLPGYDMISADPFDCSTDMPAALGCPYMIAADGDGRDPDATDPGDQIPQVALDYFQQTAEAGEVNQSSWHGLKVSGIIAATGHADAGLAGIDYYARILPVRIGGMHAQLSDLADGIRWAAGLPVPGVPANRTPAQVINLSLGFEREQVGHLCPRVLQEAIDAALGAGHTRAIVVAAGNQGANQEMLAPANCRGTIAVGAIDRAATLADFSSRGPKLLLSAPSSSLDPDAGNDFPVLSNCGTGRSIWRAQACPDPGADGAPHVYEVGIGTSVAAPMVSGTVALMLAANRSLSAGGIRHILQASARPFARGTHCAREPAQCGAGLLDAGRAVAQAAALPGGVHERGARPQ